MVLKNLLREFEAGGGFSGDQNDQCTFASPRAKIGIGLDSCVTPLHHRDLALLQTTDYFYPLVDDPFVMGRITCANVLSDLYAMGVTEIDNILMLLAVSNKMTDLERDVIMPLIMEGFKDAATEAGTFVTGGDTVVNPWLTIGGVATSVCAPDEYIMPENAEVGDVLVLTKPLGTQVIVNAHSWLESHPDLWNMINDIVSADDVMKAYDQAVKSMSRLNRTAARLMHKYNAHAATDVTGFGILGHAENLAMFQKNEVSFHINALPVISKCTGINDASGNRFQLLQGRSPESSGGLLVCLPREQAENYCKELEREEGQQAWIVGSVRRGHRSAHLVEDATVIEEPP